MASCSCAHLDQPRMVPIGSVPFGRDVGSARQAQPVDPGHHLCGHVIDLVVVDERWHRYRDAAGPNDGLLVRPSERRRRHAPRVGGVRETRRHDDQWTHQYQRTAATE